MADKIIKCEVEIDYGYYLNEHMHRPRGRGSWLFCLVRPKRDDYLEYLTPCFRGTYTEACRAAIKWARETNAAGPWPVDYIVLHVAP